VDVTLNATHTFRGDLRVVLISPDGTESVLAEKHSDGGDDYNDWRFGTIRPYEETSAGTWTLKVSDEASQDTGTFNSWSLKIYGNTGSVPTPTPTPLDVPALTSRGFLILFLLLTAFWILRNRPSNRIFHR
jgi:subtilisin-like proprotein convertase family protein